MGRRKIQRRTSLITHFWSLVDRKGPDECWPWKGNCWTGVEGGSYGMLSIGKTKELVHRMSLEMSAGPIGDLHALHKGDNPPCCNPAHLYAGTPKNNSDDRSERGRMPARFDIWHRYPYVALASFLRSKDLSATEFADLAGVSRAAAISWLYERNKPLRSAAVFVAEKLGVTVEEIFGCSAISLREKAGKSPMPAEQAAKLRSLRVSGMTVREIADQCNVCVMTVHRITKGARPRYARGNGLPRTPKTHCTWGHEFTEANTYMLSSKARICRQCQARRSKEWKANRLIRTSA